MGGPTWDERYLDPDCLRDEVELRYRSKISQPLHEPRPQLLVMNKVMAEMDDFVHAPRLTVRVLFGEEYPKGDYSHPDRIQRADCDNLIENGGYVDDLPLHLVDNPGKYLWTSVRCLV